MPRVVPTVRHRPPRAGVVAGLALAALAFAPAPAPDRSGVATKHSALAEARFRAASHQFEEVWTYYRQSRTDSFLTYYWSRLVLDSQREIVTARADRVAAAEAHLDRMRRLQELVKKVRKLGFGFSTDIGATEYYRIEAECWVEKAKSE